MLHSNANQTEIYNGLPDVIVADEKLKAMNREAILESACQTILKYNLEDLIGIRLLHNHNAINQDEMMLEQEEQSATGEYALSTVALKKGDCAPEAQPNIWKLGEHSATPLEFSIDSLVTTQTDVAITHRQFFEEFYENLRTMNVTDLLGPCIIKRDFYEKRGPGNPDRMILVETTDADRRANVLRFCPDDRYTPEQMIETTWMASRPTATAEGESVCTKGKCTGTCIVVIHCERDGDKHASSSTHNKPAHITEHIREGF